MKHTIRPKSFFIGNGLLDSQLLFVIPITHGYCLRAGIKKLVFEREISSEVNNNLLVKSILKMYEINIVSVSSPWLSRWKLLAATMLSLPTVILLAIRSVRSGLTAQCAWYEKQLRHATWDQALLSAVDGSINLSFLQRLSSAARVIRSVKYAKHLVSQHAVGACLLGHTVYAGRGLLAEFLEGDVDTLIHAGNIVYRLSPEKDSSYMFMSQLEWSRILQLTDRLEVENYWIDRNRGLSTYTDARAAFIKNLEVTIDTPKNIILLHIFRDSPFNYIDPNRIFADYIDWMMNTIEIIAKSSERWMIKTHPSASRWGENQLCWLQAIAKAVCPNGWPENIVVSDEEYSNVDLFRHARRFITYSGTMHLEAASWGKKPIVISEVALHSFNGDYVLKPNSIEEYESLLLKSSTDSVFQLSDGAAETARELIYIRERVMSFSEEIGSLTTYRGDKADIFRLDFNSVERNLSACSARLQLAGEALSSGVHRTVNFQSLPKWIQLHLDGDRDGA